LSAQCLAIRDIAYVAQEAWLRNATIRENILFGEPYSQQRYEEVLRVCALKPDLRILAAGDQTEIGERGVTLSGGQKQRVALARAIYSARRILLIDDCLAAVDAHTAKHILMECLLSTTPLMQGRTCVLVTHHVALCVPRAQYMVVMQEGRVVVQGHPQELLDSGRLAGLEIDGLESPHISTPASSTSLIDRAGDSVARQLEAVGDQMPEDKYTERRHLLAEQNGGSAGAVEGALIEEEERESGSVKLGVWVSYFRACGSVWFWAAMLWFLAAAQTMQVFQVYWIRLWITSTTNPADTGSAHSSVFWLAMYCGIGTSAALLKYAYMYISSVGSLRASQAIHTKLVRSIVHAVPRFFDTTPLGRIVNRFARDMTLIDENAMDNIAWWLMDTAGVLAVFAIIIAVTPAFILVAVGISFVYMSIAYYYLAASRELKRLESTSMSPLMSLFGEMIQGTASIRAFGAQKYYIREALTRISAHCRPFYLVWATNRWLSLRVDWAGALVSFTCIVLALANMQNVDAALAGFVLSYALTFSDRMIWVIRSYAINELNMNAVERIN
ncbi:Transporter of the ATP-binding cassette (ABC), partial [Linderina pennispora]